MYIKESILESISNRNVSIDGYVMIFHIFQNANGLRMTENTLMNIRYENTITEIKDRNCTEIIIEKKSSGLYQGSSRSGERETSCEC